MNVTMCDYDECPNEARYHVKVIDSEDSFFGLMFDICRVHHANGYLKHAEAQQRADGSWVEESA